MDRDKAQALGVPISDIFTALQATLGGFYVNNFNLFGRTWQVNIQAEAADRDDVSDIWRIRVRNKPRRHGAAAGVRRCRASWSGRRSSPATTIIAR